jgi:hypothetical protein
LDGKIWKFLPKKMTRKSREIARENFRKSWREGAIEVAAILGAGAPQSRGWSDDDAAHVLAPKPNTFGR